MTDTDFLRHALDLARRGQGRVEPNPMVGALIVRNGEILASGWHRKYGGPHAEIEAFRDADERGIDTSGATMYVTLEPCCHFGKTPPCSSEIIRRKIGRVVAAMTDPNPLVSGHGLQQIRNAGIEVSLAPDEIQAEALALNAPFIRMITTHRPWVIAKYACTLDGKIAARTGDSRWISNELSRTWVHQLRSRVDAILVGAGTFLTDDPLLTARLPDGQVPPRYALRIVFDLRGPLPEKSSMLEKTADDFPTLFAIADAALSDHDYQRLESAGAEVFVCQGETSAERMLFLLKELGHRWKTNVLVEGGSRCLGTLFDLQQINEVHAFFAPVICGGEKALGPIAGLGSASMAEAARITNPKMQLFGNDVLVSGPVEYCTHQEQIEDTL